MGESQIVVCQLNGERFGLDISRVFEIIRLQSPTGVPGSPAHVCGVINLRGRLVPIVVVGSENARLGLVMDAVSEVLSVSADSIEPGPTSVGEKRDQALMKGIAMIGDQLIMLLELDALFVEETRRAPSWTMPLS